MKVLKDLKYEPKYVADEKATKTSFALDELKVSKSVLNLIRTVASEICITRRNCVWHVLHDGQKFQ